MNKEELIKIAGKHNIDWDLLVKECHRQDIDINEYINWSDSIALLEHELIALVITGFCMDR